MLKKIKFNFIYPGILVILFFIATLSVHAASSAPSYITLDVTNNSIANCKIDGSTDDFKSLNKIINYITSSPSAYILLFPYTGKSMVLSDTVNITRGNIILKLNCNIQFTKSKYSKEDSMNVFEIGYSRYSRTPIYNVQIIGNNIEINGNGDNLSYIEKSHTKPNYGDIIHLRRVINGSISGIICNNAVENGLRVYMCQNITVENCEFKNTKLDNGLTVMGLPVYTDDWTYNDETCNNNIAVRNCISHNNKDVGFSASICRNVLFDTCTSYENGTSNGFNAGGGFSHECLGFSTYYDQPTTWNGLTTFYNCKAYNNQNYGIYTDANGTIINKCIIDGTIQNKNDNYGRSIYGGNAIYAMSAKGAISIIDTTIKNSDSYAIAYSNSSASIDSALNIQNISITNVAKGIYCLNATTIIINKARLTNIPTAPLNFLDGDKKGTIYLKNFTTANIGKMLIGNANKLIVDNTISY